MKVLVAGLTPQSSAAVEMIVGSLFKSATIVPHLRGRHLAPRDLQGDVRQCDVLVVDLVGFGWSTVNPAREAELYESVLLDKPTILLLPAGDDGPWQRTRPRADGEAPHLMLQQPVSMGMLQDALRGIHRFLEDRRVASLPVLTERVVATPPPAPKPPPPAAGPDRSPAPARPAPPVAVPQSPVATPKVAVPAPAPAPLAAVVPRAAHAPGPAQVPRPAPVPQPGPATRRVVVVEPMRPSLVQRSTARSQGAALPAEPWVDQAHDEIADRIAEDFPDTVADPFEPSPRNDRAWAAGRPAGEPTSVLSAAVPGAEPAFAASLPPGQLMPANDEPERASIEADGDVPPFGLARADLATVVSACPALMLYPFLNLMLDIALRDTPSELSVGTDPGAVFCPAENWVVANIPTGLRNGLTQNHMLLGIVGVKALGVPAARQRALQLFGRRDDGRRPLESFIFDLVLDTLRNDPPDVSDALEFKLSRLPNFTRLPGTPDLFIQLALFAVNRSLSMGELRRLFARHDPRLVSLFVLCVVLSGMATVSPLRPASDGARRPMDNRPSQGPLAPMRGFIKSLLAKLF